MSRSSPSMEELELARIRETELQLLKLERQSAENREKIARQRRESDRTMPPLEEIQARAERIQHEQSVSRGEIVNVRRMHDRSLMLLVLLVTATCALVWWGLTLMQGG